MNTELSWEERNGRYLSASIRWLRLLLALQIEAAEHSPGVDASSREKFRPDSSDGEPPTALADDDSVRAVAEVADLASGMEPPPALSILAQRFGLSRFEEEVLLLCAATELDTRIAPLCARAQGDSSRPFPTFALALTIFDDGAWDALSPDRPLRYWRLIEISQPPGQPLTTSALRADERIVNYLKGLNVLDERLAPILDVFEEANPFAPLPPSTEATVDRVSRLLQRAVAGPQMNLVQLLGSDVDSKKLVAKHAAARLGVPLYRLPIRLLPDHVGELENFSRLWHRENLLRLLVLYLDADEADGLGPQETQRVDRFLSKSVGRTVLAAREAWPSVGPMNSMVDVARPTPAEQEAVWANALGADAGESPSILAGQFDLSLKTIDDILCIKPSDEESLWRECVTSTRPRVQSLGERLDSRSTWNDFVLPPAELKLLHQLADQVRHRSTVYDGWGFRRKMTRGLGISALFAGLSGTGKTMAGEVLANDLRLELFRIDLSTTIDKYVGETPKNIRKIFDGAEGGGVILFFDEADALFGKRSEVKDSLDRYANVEINYLLQRMESYRGLAILATNMKSALDTAFMRRLRFVIDFPFPGVAERRLIWQKVFPVAAPLRALDFDRLAKLNVPGGSIHSIALNAAFLAAAAGSPITMEIVLDAARTEFRKLEKPINEADFEVAAVGGAAA
jgi:Winged helix domain, variant/ATPase family associated with various cellular activities (AAA)